MCDIQLGYIALSAGNNTCVDIHCAILCHFITHCNHTSLLQTLMHTFTGNNFTWTHVHAVLKLWLDVLEGLHCSMKSKLMHNLMQNTKHQLSKVHLICHAVSCGSLFFTIEVTVVCQPRVFRHICGHSLTDASTAEIGDSFQLFVVKEEIEGPDITILT